MKTIITITLVFVTVACSPHATYNQLNDLRKAMPLDEARSKLPTEINGTNDFSFQQSKYHIEYYNLQTSFKKQTYSQNAVWSPFKETETTETRTTDLNTVIIVYRDNKVRYWGFLGDYAKSEDPDMFLISPILDSLLADVETSSQEVKTSNTKRYDK